MSQPNLQCMGIDVAKLSLDIATTDTIEPFTVGNAVSYTHLRATRP